MDEESPDPAAPGAPAVDPKLLESLVCPLTHGTLEYDPVKARLISRKAGLAFPIRNGVPIMLEHEATPISE